VTEGKQCMRNRQRQNPFSKSRGTWTRSCVRERASSLRGRILVPGYSLRLVRHRERRHGTRERRCVSPCGLRLSPLRRSAFPLSSSVIPLSYSEPPSLRRLLPSLRRLATKLRPLLPSFRSTLPFLRSASPLFVQLSPLLGGNGRREGRSRRSFAGSARREGNDRPRKGERRKAEVGRQGCRRSQGEAVRESYFTPSSSTSKIRVAFGGITPPAPRAP
jgi:hypothetical protein